jgi:hypothetical protein
MTSQRMIVLVKISSEVRFAYYCNNGVEIDGEFEVRA